ncbi:UNVERIFIED_CONTAM: hypothetical protein NCL1_53298 [Trichonephila clavipes]
MMEHTCSSCCSTDNPFFQFFFGVFIKRGKIDLKPKISTNLLQLSAPSALHIAWSRTFRAPLRDIFFSRSIRFINCKPSPFKKRSRLAANMRDEHRQSKRFSIISCSSLFDGSFRLKYANC